MSLKIKWLVYPGVAKVTKKGGPKVYERSLKIIENKWRKMRVLCLAIMLLKIS
jgi:hypothetical protein